MGRHGALFFLDRLPLSALQKFAILLLAGHGNRKTKEMRPGERLCAALQDMGPSFIKLGQALSCRPDLVGDDIADDLGALRDRLPPFDALAARAALEADLGHRVDDLFMSFDNTPVAAASIAQVHFAVTKDNTAVAVKILRPGIEAAFARDLALFSWIAALLERRFPEARRLRAVDVVETLRATVVAEMDLRLEAAAAAELADNFVDQPMLRVPAIYWPLTGQRVLTMARVEGLSIADPAALVAAGHELPVLATRLIQFFLTQAMVHGFFHADQHPGNLFVAADGAIVVVDFGIMGRLDRQTRLFFAEMIHAFLSGDWQRAAEVHFAAGYVTSDHSIAAFAQACRAIGQPILNRPMEEISPAKLLAQLFQVTAQFGMQTQPHLLLLQKTMATVVGVARLLDPHINFWHAARPVVEPWARENLSLEAKLYDAAAAGFRAVREFPKILNIINVLKEKADKNTLSPSPIVRQTTWIGWISLVLAVIALLVALSQRS